MTRVMKFCLWIGALHAIVVFIQQYKRYDGSGSIAAGLAAAVVIFIFWLLVGFLIKLIMAVFSKASNEVKAMHRATLPPEVPPEGRPREVANRKEN